MRLRNGLHDGQAQAAAGGAVLGGGGAHEALHGALAVFGGDAGAAVFHGEHGVVARSAHLQVHLAARRGVLDGVVEQVARQHAQRLGVAGHGGRVGVEQAHVHAARLGRWGHVGQGQGGDGAQVHGLGGDRARFLPGQGQQLLHQPGGTVDAAGQALGGGGTRRIVARALQALQLQTQRGQGRAQFVRGIGHKMLLRIEGALHALEQQVEFPDQGLHFVGQLGIVHGRQVVGLALGELAAHALHRGQRAAHAPPHGQHQERRHEGQRRQRAQRQAAGHALPHGHVLRHLDDLRARLHREHPVGAAACLYVGEAQHGDLRQGRAHGRFKNAQAFVGPDLHDEFVVFILGRRRRTDALGVHRQARAQRQRGLLHVVVEQRVGLGQCAAVGQRALHGAGQHDGGE